MSSLCAQFYTSRKTGDWSYAKFDSLLASLAGNQHGSGKEWELGGTHEKDGSQGKQQLKYFKFSPIPDGTLLKSEINSSCFLKEHLQMPQIAVMLRMLLLNSIQTTTTVTQMNAPDNHLDNGFSRQQTSTAHASYSKRGSSKQLAQVSTMKEVIFLWHCTAMKLPKFHYKFTLHQFGLLHGHGMNQRWDNSFLHCSWCKKGMKIGLRDSHSRVFSFVKL